MVKRLLLLLVTAFISLNFIGAAERWQETPRVGIAIEDSSSAALVNLASIGVGNASGIGWSGYMNDRGMNNYSFHTTLSRFSYAYRDFNGVDNHELALGFPIFEGLYFGAGARWDWQEKAGLNTHLLYRPWNFISFGFKGESLNRSPWMDWGTGLRPLVFSDYWGSRFTLFYDGRVTSRGGYDSIATGLRVMPVDGLEFYGHWDFRDEKFVAGLNLSWHRLLVGGEVTTSGKEAWSEGNVQAFVSVKDMRTLSARKNRLIIYDTAQIITDTPRLYARAQDLRPDPNPTRSLYEFISDMETIMAHPEIEAILFDNQAMSTSFSNLIEIEQILLRMKESGKKIYFYADTMGSNQYALAASVADGIFMSPQGSMDLTGFGVTNLYFKDLLARYGVNIINFKSHEYKSAYDTLSESEMSDAQRVSLETIYSGLQEEMNRMINQGRDGKIIGNLESLYGEGYWMTSARARETGLIDEVLYRDQLETWLGMKRYSVGYFSRFRWDMEYDWKITNRPNIAVIYANGGISMGTGSRGSSIGADSLANAIKGARNNPMVSAIVLRVNSGGGSALASDIIAREVALCTIGSRPKPVIVSMGGTAASGGYMISAPASRVLATPVTITGSIGVITVIPDVSGLLEMFDVGVGTVTTTESADVPNIFRPLTKTEEQRIRNSIMENYDSFVTMVAANRSMSPEAVNEAAQGRIWTGRQAMDRKLVDGMGGLAEAINLAEDMAGVRNARILEINPGKVRMNFPGIPGGLAAFLGMEAPDPLAMVPDDLKDVIEFYKSISEYERGEALFLMPYTSEELGLEDRD